MAGVIVRFENGKLPYESWQALQPFVENHSLDCIEANPNGLFLFYGMGIIDESVCIELADKIQAGVPAVHSVEADPCL